MKIETNKLAHMSVEEKRELLRQLLSREEDQQNIGHGEDEIPEEFYRLEKFSEYRMLVEQAAIFKTLAMNNPYFSPHEGVSDHTTHIDGKVYINYSGYNYLGL